MVAAGMSGEICIRRYGQGDSEPLYEAVRESMAEVGRWMSWCHSGYSREDSRAWVESREAAWAAGQEFSFVIEEQASGLFLGGTGINLINSEHGFGNLGYWVRTSASGRGVASRAARLVAAFAFGECGLARLEIVVAAGNLASRKAAAKAGAREEGLLRNRLRVHGEAHDAYMYSLVPADLVV